MRLVHLFLKKRKIIFVFNYIITWSIYISIILIDDRPLIWWIKYFLSSFKFLEKISKFLLYLFRQICLINNSGIEFSKIWNYCYDLITPYFCEKCISLAPIKIANGILATLTSNETLKHIYSREKQNIL